MSSNGNNAAGPSRNVFLTPRQQTMLFAVLNPGAQSPTAAGATADGSLVSPSSLSSSPTQGVDANALAESPYLASDYDFNGPDSSLDLSFDDDAATTLPRMIGDLPGASTSPEADSSDKRSHPDDDDEDGNGAKRRGGEEKVAKKPGRKPLLTEPTSKRKAQNRAAQRAFRERKEKHLKDLETRVEELQKASEDANHENSLLRAQVEKMTVELSEYKNRMSLMPAARLSNSRAPTMSWGTGCINNINDVNFQFEFPKFGSLPGQQPARQPPTPAASTASSSARKNSNDKSSPAEQSPDGASPANSSNHGQVKADSQAKDDGPQLSPGFSMSQPSNTSLDTNNSSRISLDSHFSGLGATTTSSPSASSNCNTGGQTSSCATSPEPPAQSPLGFKPLDPLTTIGEEQHAQPVPQGFADVNSFAGWLPQNDFQFDPHLFGGYRESQDSILSNGFDDMLFNNSLEVDFTTPYNLPTTATATPSGGGGGGGEGTKDQQAPKKDLIAMIDEAKNTDQVGNDGQLLTCSEIWNNLQNCSKVQSGDLDLDSLCSDLQKKAKCSGYGPVLNEEDFKSVMVKHLGPDAPDKCPFTGRPLSNAP